MSPVTSNGLDELVPQLNQTIALWVTIFIAATSLIVLARFCKKHKIWWPWLIVISGTLTFLQEPLYDHLYGLWFFEEGQQNIVTTYGIHVPLWLPIIYIAYYGCGTIWYWWQIEKGATMRMIMAFFAVEVLIAAACEMFYINAVGLYNYQSNQPFMIFNYPVFVAIINGVPPTLAGIILYKLVPVLNRGWEKLLLIGVLPVTFAANTFGGCWLYLSARHLADQTSQFVLYMAAISAVLASIAIIYAAAKMAGISQSSTKVMPSLKKAGP